MIDNNILSPITLSSNIKLIDTIPSSSIIRGYRNGLNIEISKYFDKLPEIYKYRCIDSGYEFYYPFNLTGDSEFYSELMNNKWYYMPWKWEHEIAANQIKITDRVLEIGCGKGDFLNKINSICSESTGLEMNQSAIEEAKKKGLNIYSDTIEEHTKNKSEFYDVVCSFQVLEHIPNVYGFIESSLKSLKSSGKLIISVPNNDSFIKYDKENLLNMPPHHVGLWTYQSLKYLSEIFDIELDKVYFEPLQDYHFLWYINSFLQKKFKLIPIIRKMLSIILYPFCYIYLKLNKNKINGHTFLIIFIKK
jgi:SAM-dependent methyltransferase